MHLQIIPPMHGTMSQIESDLNLYFKIRISLTMILLFLHTAVRNILGQMGRDRQTYGHTDIQTIRQTD